MPSLEPAARAAPEPSPVLFAAGHLHYEVPGGDGLAACRAGSSGWICEPAPPGASGHKRGDRLRREGPMGILQGREWR